jgi:signal transduction histidine kinase
VTRDDFPVGDGAPGLPPALAALAVHDLKNALGSLEARLELLDRALSVDPSQPVVPSDPSALARDARQQCQQLRREALALLTLYKGEALRAVVEDESPVALLQALTSDARRRGVAVDIEVRAHAAPPFWFLDARLVKLALDAALDNALRHARGHVWLSAAPEADGLCLTVEDDGPGLHGVAASGPRGAWQTGLGTALCRAVAQAHVRPGGAGDVRGKVTLEDRPEGGARFRLWLP